MSASITFISLRALITSITLRTFRTLFTRFALNTLLTLRTLSASITLVTFNTLNTSRTGDIKSSSSNTNFRSSYISYSIYISRLSDNSITYSHSSRRYCRQCNLSINCICSRYKDTCTLITFISLITFVTRNTLDTLCTLGTGITFISLRTFWTHRTLITSITFISLRKNEIKNSSISCTRISHRCSLTCCYRSNCNCTCSTSCTSIALRTCRTNFTLKTSRALDTLITFLTLITLVTFFTLRTLETISTRKVSNKFISCITFAIQFCIVFIIYITCSNSNESTDFYIVCSITSIHLVYRFINLGDCKSISFFTFFTLKTSRALSSCIALVTFFTLKTSRKSEVQNCMVFISSISYFSKISSSNFTDLNSCCRTSFTLKTSFTFFSLISLRTNYTRNTLNTLNTLKTSRTLFTLVTFFTFFTLRTGRTYITFISLRTLSTSITLVSLRTRNTLDTLFTLRTGRTSRTNITLVTLRKNEIKYRSCFCTRILYRSTFTYFYFTDQNSCTLTLRTFWTNFALLTLRTSRTYKISTRCGFYSNFCFRNFCNSIYFTRRS